MKAVFIESSEFTAWVSNDLADDAYAEFQQLLMEKPNTGRVMPGCGGLRKIRIADPRRGKGKRSVARIIYLYVPDVKWFYLLDVYDKDQKETLTADEKRILKQLAAQLQREAKAASRRRPEKS